MASYFDDHDADEQSTPGRDPNMLMLTELISNIAVESDWTTRADFSLQDLIARVGQIHPEILTNLEEVNNNPPAAEEVIENLPTIEVEPHRASGGRTACPICTEEFEEGPTATELPCGHIYHRSCVIPWLRKKNTCPMCRHELQTDDPVYEQQKKDRARRAAAEELYSAGMYT